MSQNKVNEGTNQLFVNLDVSQIFLGGQHTTDKYSYINNSSYDPITLYAGTVLGRIGSTGILIPTESNASDGSQKVYGVLMQNLTIDSGDSVKALVCTGGRVAAEKLVFVKPGDSLDTAVSNVRYADKIEAETLGIQLVWTDEMTGADNS